MNWITPEIAIGNHSEAADVVLLSKEDVRAVLGLIDTLAAKNAEEMGLEAIVVVPLQDGPDNAPERFDDAIRALGRLIEQHGKVLVHCHLGRSRSAAVVAGHLMRSQNLSKDEALQLISTKREIYITAGVELMLDRLS
ncbi:dual specificity protein phosphatase family protein [Tuwongella immobilis]|uniref:protein-tyrosine-phosphatase n=1 Tax=Tuwongella immobilis TaxID=692036 RepID=A0A6C2YK62_9BACT|nr:dual specificity protein phosphatase [Tuwongella immobilis]VIP01495.1 dual specificity phosphatase-like protein : Dual specificity protein phosphatase OS=Pedosphaera parvula (strain Ellin514) GN=Cflav_PD3419 PE=4 SV=1: DSPc [Tuwongella immobilis]VTR98577.1 dual specificity phosphatase-like protein : Dual specificity protein phosphatase OS=Pedosphaera parvula (strain Ellin514) GN=Cflav_PD3419 PE=4 SV=1: DSPc [Tuwongella immobilis]